MRLVDWGCRMKENVSESVLNTKCKQRPSAVQCLMFSDKDQLHVCSVGVPYLEADNTLLIGFFSTRTWRWFMSRQKWKSGQFLAVISSSASIFVALLRVWCQTNQTETQRFSPLDRWAPTRDRARRIIRPWLDFFSFSSSWRVAGGGSRSRHGDGGDRSHWGVDHHLPGLLHCPGGGVPTPLLPPSRPAAPLRLQVS